jgi:hypothetical protein
MTLFPPARKEGRALRWGALDVGLRAPKSRRRLPFSTAGEGVISVHIGMGDSAAVRIEKVGFAIDSRPPSYSPYSVFSLSLGSADKNETDRTAHARSVTAHGSPRTSKLYDRIKKRLTQNKVERLRR